MLSIKIDDILFAHGDYSTAIQQSKYITWNRNFILGNEEVAVWTDQSLSRVNNRVKTKIGWLLESPAVSAYQHEWMKVNHRYFDIVFTNNKDLLDIDNNKFKFVPTGGCWIKPDDQKIYPKTKLVSIIASNKNWTDGHRMRNSIVNEIMHGRLKGKVDLFGRGFNDIPDKLDGLKDYMFSIVVENTKKDYYFTEKIIDCFATGTIPIYWGCPSISNFFHKNGMIEFNDLDGLINIINSLSPDNYNEILLKDNFDQSRKYMIAEDYMYENYIGKI